MGKAAVKTPAGETAERLLIEAAQRDPGRFAELYENHFERIYAFIIRRVRDRDEAEDLTADVFHQALANLGRFEWRGVPFSAWLFRIAANAVVDRAKQAAKQRALPEVDDATEIDFGEIEQRARLFQLVGRLPEEQRRVIMMRFAQQKPIRDIAREIGRSEGAVKQLQFRGLQSLRAQMSDPNG